jgi:RNA polymerase sigma factor (TIGR02999 family)
MVDDQAIPAGRDDVTNWLRAWSSGDERALHRLAPLVHRELARIAKAYLAREPNANSWQPTMLVNEAFLRLIDCQRVDWQGRAHFLRLAAKKMREILIDYFRKKRFEKRLGKVRVVSMDEATPVQTGAEEPVDMILLHDALNQLEAFDQRKAQIVEMRFFGGLSIDEIAQTLDLSVATVHRDLHLARRWLYRAMEGKRDGS